MNRGTTTAMTGIAISQKLSNASINRGEQAGGIVTYKTSVSVLEKVREGKL